MRCSGPATRPVACRTFCQGWVNPVQGRDEIGGKAWLHGARLLSALWKRRFCWTWGQRRDDHLGGAGQRGHAAYAASKKPAASAQCAFCVTRNDPLYQFTRSCSRQQTGSLNGTSASALAKAPAAVTLPRNASMRGQFFRRPSKRSMLLSLLDAPSFRGYQRWTGELSSI